MCSFVRWTLSHDSSYHCCHCVDKDTSCSGKYAAVCSVVRIQTFVGPSNSSVTSGVGTVGLVGCLLFFVRFYWDIVMCVHLLIVYGCFCAIMMKLNSCKRDSWPTVYSVHCPSLRRECLVIIDGLLL
jgi:hypothetical protein